MIKKKYRKLKIVENIEDYDDKLVSLENLELTFAESEKNRAIFDEINKLKKEDKEIFISYYYEGKRIKEISIIFNISESKVKSKLFRIRKRLNKILKERGYSYDG